jgi:hypothetical protein
LIFRVTWFCGGAGFNNTSQAIGLARGSRNTINKALNANATTLRVLDLSGNLKPGVSTMAQIRFGTFLAAGVLSSAALAVSAPAQAAIINGSFENIAGFVPDVNDTMSLLGGSNVMTGWTVIGDSLAWIGPTNPFSLAAFDGGYFLDLTDYALGPPFGGVSQSLGTVAGHNYQVTFDLGSSSRWGGQSGLRVAAGSTFSDYLSTTSPGLNTWQPETFNFVASGPTTALSFLGTVGVNYIGLDNIVVNDLGPQPLDSGVPEPATWTLILVGFGAVGWAMRSGRALNRVRGSKGHLA